MSTKSRRGFLQTALIAAGGAAGLLANVKFDATDGVKIGKTSVKVGMSEALAQCGFSADCSGGGGQCGFSADCAGGGGKCGFSANCAGQ